MVTNTLERAKGVYGEHFRTAFVLIMATATCIGMIWVAHRGPKPLNSLPMEFIMDTFANQDIGKELHRFWVQDEAVGVAPN